jgi:two-component system, NtrC family, response regulator GlrR
MFTPNTQPPDPLSDPGLFRQDLLYRLKLLELKVPPLRDRKDDIPVLANHFVATASLRFGKPAKPIHPDTLAWFQLYSWPGNIRELENLVHREFLMSQGGMIEVGPPAALRTAEGHDAPTSNAFSYLHAKRVAIHDFENRFLRQLIAQTGGNISAAARLCGTERRHLGRLIRKHHITKP